MARRLIEHDPLQGKSVYHHYDYATDVTRIETVYDVEPVLKMNKERAKDKSYEQKGIKSGWWHVGTIPNGVIAKWLQEGVNFYDQNDWPAVKRKLNSPEYSYLRTGRGKL